MNNIKCLLAYCGTRYFGFQKTDRGPSIEGVLENTLEKILQHPVKIQAASRTDRHVHAEGQVINFFTEKSFDLGKLHESMRSLLPSDIAPLKLEWAHEAFHPTLDNVGKEYHYLICNSPTQIPFYQEFSWHFYLPLDIKKMHKAAQLLQGEKDFSAFSSLKYDNPVRTIDLIKIVKLPKNRLLIKIKGNHFLYKMARNLVGTLVYIGCGRMKIADLPQIIQSKQRALIGMTAPGHGLYLKRVFY